MALAKKMYVIIRIGGDWVEIMGRCRSRGKDLITSVLCSCIGTSWSQEPNDDYEPNTNVSIMLRHAPLSVQGEVLSALNMSLTCVYGDVETPIIFATPYRRLRAGLVDGVTQWLATQGKAIFRLPRSEKLVEELRNYVAAENRRMVLSLLLAEAEDVSLVDTSDYAHALLRALAIHMVDCEAGAGTLELFVSYPGCRAKDRYPTLAEFAEGIGWELPTERAPKKVESLLGLGC
jgi:hypothetical protein